MRNPSGFPRGFPVERQTQGKDWRCLTDSRLPHVSWHVSTIFSCSTHLAILSFWKCFLWILMSVCWSICLFVGLLVCRTYFPKQTGSETLMFLSEHLLHNGLPLQNSIVERNCHGTESIISLSIYYSSFFLWSIYFSRKKKKMTGKKKMEF